MTLFEWHDHRHYHQYLSSPPSKPPAASLSSSQPDRSQLYRFDCNTTRLSVSIETTSRTPAKHTIQSTPRLDARRLSRSHAHLRYPAFAYQPATKTSTLSIINPASPARARRSEAKKLDNAMHGRSCAPAILIIALTLLGMAWHGMT
jgi:hypothetical protein